MRKIKQIALVCIAAIGLFSCESEKIDEVSKDDSLVGEKILRFDLNGQTRIARGNDIIVTMSADSSITIKATIKDVYSDYKPITFTTNISHLSKGNFVTDPTKMDPLNPLYASASLKLPQDTWTYSTSFAPETVLDKGNLIIQHWNANAQQIEGNFAFNVYPMPQEPVEGVTPPTMLKIQNGYFKYLHY